jgi:hypothetical protein
MSNRLTNLFSRLKRDKKRKRAYSQLLQELDYRNKKTDMLWRRTFLQLRIVWAIVPLFLLVGACWFTYWLTEGIGHGKLDFKDYKVYLGIVAGDLIVNVLGLVYIVMRFLFPHKNGDDSSKQKEAEEEDLFELPSSRQ